MQPSTLNNDLVTEHVTNYNAAQSNEISSSVPVKVLSARPKRARFRLVNVGSVALYWSNDAAVAASGAHRGLPLTPSLSPFDNVEDYLNTGDLYVIAGAGGSDLLVSETY